MQENTAQQILMMSYDECEKYIIYYVRCKSGLLASAKSVTMYHSQLA